MPHTRPLKTADARLRVLEEKLNVGTWTWEISTNEVSWSPGLFRVLGFDPATITPTLDLYRALVHPDDRLPDHGSIALAADKRLLNRRFRVIRPDGSLRWLHSRAQPHLDRNGKTILLFGVIVDVTEDEEAKAEVIAEAKVAGVLLKLLKGKLWRADAQGRLVDTMAWLHRAESDGQDRIREVLEAIHPEDRDIFRVAWRKAVASKDEHRVNIRIRSHSGEYVRMTSHAMPILQPNGQVEQWIGHNIVIDRDDRAQATPEQICAAQIRAARGFLDWTAQDLANRSGVSFSTIRRMETSTQAVRTESVRLVKAAFEKHGLTFRVGGDESVSISFSKPSTT